MPEKDTETPFSKYFPVKLSCRNSYFAREIFRPEMDFFEKENCLYASTNNSLYPVYNADSLIKSRVNPRGAKSYFKGMIGENLLSIILKELVSEAKKEFSGNGTSVLCDIIAEDKNHKGKEFVVTWNEKYILKHKCEKNFVILQKSLDNDPVYTYSQQKHGIFATEIDGLAYFISTKKQNSQCMKTLLVGESKTTHSEAYLKRCLRQKSRKSDTATLAEKIFIPLSSLFKEHDFIYVFLGNESLLWNTNRKKVNGIMSGLIDDLRRINVSTILVPIPQMPQKIRVYSEKIFEKFIEEKRK